MPDAAIWVTVASVVLASITFVAMQLTGKRAGAESYVAQIEHRLEACSDQLERRDDRIATLEAENLHLMRKLLKANGTEGKP